MSNRLKISYGIGLLLFTAISCNKEGETDGSEHGIEVTLTEESVYGVYHFYTFVSDTLVDLNNDGAMSNNLLLELEECVIDNLYNFTFRNSYEFIDENKKCEDAEATGNTVIINSGTYKVYPIQNTTAGDTTIEFFDQQGNLSETWTNAKLYRLRGIGKKTLIGIIFDEESDSYRTLTLKEK